MRGGYWKRKSDITYLITRCNCFMDALEEYILAHIDPEPEILKEIARDTHAKRLYANMISGHMQGRLLAMITRMIGAKQVLEVGTFIGYSALCFAEGLGEGGEVHTIEVNDELEDVIRDHVSKDKQGDKVILHIGDAVDIIPTFDDERFDLAFLDGGKENYWRHYEILLPKVRKGGVILVDNTLWYRKVVSRAKDSDETTRAVQRFNDLLAKDRRVEKVILPIRDGVTLIRKK